MYKMTERERKDKEILENLERKAKEESRQELRKNLTGCLLWTIGILGFMALVGFGPAFFESFGEYRRAAVWIFVVIATGVIALVIKICDG